MSLLFKVGDVVYGASFGKGVVENVDNSSIPYQVRHIGGCSWTHERLLSFTPWPAPNHVRPVQEGLHIIKFDGYEYLAVYRNDSWYWSRGDYKDWCNVKMHAQDKAQSVKFLSKLPKN